MAKFSFIEEIEIEIKSKWEVAIVHFLHACMFATTMLHGASISIGFTSNQWLHSSFDTAY